jgi:hypothetical protein
VLVSHHLLSLFRLTYCYRSKELEFYSLLMGLPNSFRAITSFIVPSTFGDSSLKSRPQMFRGRWDSEHTNQALEAALEKARKLHAKLSSHFKTQSITTRIKYPSSPRSSFSTCQYGLRIPDSSVFSIWDYPCRRKYIGSIPEVRIKA